MVRIYTYLEIYLDDVNKLVSLSEFEIYFKKPHQTIKNHLKTFLQSKILIEQKRERFLFYKLNLENPLTYEYLSLCEKERLITFLEKNILFSRLYNEISQFFTVSKIILFGSCVYEKNYNDIDILIISKNLDIKKVLNKFELTYSKKIHLIQTQKEDLTKTFILEIKKNHIIFNNHDYFTEVLYK